MPLLHFYQDKINQWFIDNRDEKTGEFPDFDRLENGSKEVLDPKPVVEQAEEAVDDKKGGKKVA